MLHFYFFHMKKKSKSSFYLTQSCGLFIPEAQCVSIIKLLPLSIIYFYKNAEKRKKNNRKKIVNFWYEVHEIWKETRFARIIFDVIYLIDEYMYVGTWFHYHILDFLCLSLLAEATMEADVAKGRRDWAFSERDKVVLERESIRTLCDKLRRERDR